MNGYAIPYRPIGATRFEPYSDFKNQTDEPSIEKSKESTYTGRAISDVNRDVSNRMIAAASDSPPLIPKRDYEIQSNTSHFGESNGDTLDKAGDRNQKSTDRKETFQDSDSQAGPLPGPFGPERFPGFPPDPFAPYVPHGPPIPPGHVGEQQLSMIGPPGLPGMHYPPPPPPWGGRPPPLALPPPGPDPHMTGVYANPGLLFTPHGPILAGEPPKPPKRKKEKKKKQGGMSRAQSCDQGFLGVPPPMPFPALPPPPMIENPYGIMGPPAPYARSEQIGMPPLRLSLPAPYPRAQTECGSQFGTGFTRGSIIMGQPPPHRETRGSQLVNQELSNGNGKSATLNSDSLSNPSDKKLTEKGHKHSKCREICCDSGLTTVIWVIIGLILLGLIIGLALGLTIV